jgi:hypothetical protein
MTDKKITELNNLTGANLVDADEFVVVDISADETKAITAGQLKAFFLTTFLPLAGGTMTGSISYGANRARFGATNEFDIYQTGTIALITAETSNIWLRNTATDGVIQIQTDNGSGGNANYITCDGATGEVILGHYGSAKLTTKAGGVGITGTLTSTAASTAAHVLNRTSSIGSIESFQSAGITVGTISVTGSATAYNTSSDYRLKENITPIQGAADIVKMMRPCTYTFKADGSWADGFIAHEMQELHPQAVTGSKDAMMDEEYEVSPAVVDDEGTVVEDAVMTTRSVPDYQGVDYSKLTPILTAALQEALNKIEDLQARMAVLEAT